MALTKRRPGLVYPVYEDWIYAGSGGSAPAFTQTTGVDNWSNVGSPWPAMAFRLRETGIVDLAGTLERTGAGGTIFTLPAKYRPTEQAHFPVVHQVASVKSALLLTVSTTGQVRVGDAASGDIVYINGSIFLNTAAP